MIRYIEHPTSEEFDLAVIGGGISGACVAYEAASRGLSVALFEKNDFGGATSSATSKLIHGGLRYLNYFEFGLVRESLRERRILEDIAPNLVYPLPFLIPNYRGVTTNRWVLKAGMILYDLLSFDRGWTVHESKRLPYHHTIDAQAARKIAPLLPEEKLTGAHIYYDCQSIFPERLTLSFLKSAEAHGAKLSNYSAVTAFGRSEQGRITSISVRDVLNGKETQVRSKLVINSAGPWASRLLEEAAGKASDHPLRMSEGIHLLVPQFSQTHALVMMTPSHRHFFIIPWRGRSLVGTTDREFVGNPDDYRVSEQSIREFLGDINQTFGKEVLKFSDIQHAYGGLRPLTDTHTESTYSSSRKYEVLDGERDGNAGLITVEGGKYTTSRNLAEGVLRMVKKKLGRKIPATSTRKKPLSGSEMYSIRQFVEDARSGNPGFDKDTLEFLARAFGTAYKEVLSLAAENQAFKERITSDGEILAEVVYAVRKEMARHLLDVVLRRTGVGDLGLPPDEILQKIARVMADELSWTDVKMQSEIADAKRYLTLPGKSK